MITIKIAGTLMIICTSTGELSAKYSRITPSAGATAAPAITVKRDSDRMLTTSAFPVFSSDFITIPPYELYFRAPLSAPYEKKRKSFCLDLRFSLRNVII